MHQFGDSFLKRSDGSIHTVNFIQPILQTSNFPVLFFDYRVQPLNFLGDHSDLVLILSDFPSQFSSIIQSPFQLLIIIADYFELIIELGDLIRRESQILLGVSQLIVQMGALLSQFIDL